MKNLQGRYLAGGERASLLNNRWGRFCTDTLWDARDYLSVNLLSYKQIPWNGLKHLAAPCLHGTLKRQYPVKSLTREVSGVAAGSYFDDFYHYIHIYPKRYDLGIITEERTIEVIVWNAFLRPHLLKKVYDLPSGVSLDVKLPTKMRQFEEKKWHFIIGTEGDAIVDTPHFLFRRMVLFPLFHNWKQSVKEVLEWKTEILSSQGLFEQRRALRQTPRRRYEYEFLAADFDRQRLDTLLLRWGNKYFALPIFSQVQRLSKALSVGSKSIPCDTSCRDFGAGKTVMLTDGTQNELVSITGKTANELELSSATLLAWEEGTLIYPCVAAILSELPTIKRRSDTVSEFSANFFVLEKRLKANPPLLPTYRGRFVLNILPDESKDLSYGQRKLRKVLDTVSGIPFFVDVARVSLPIQSWAWLGATRQKLEEILSIIEFLHGRQKSIWLPSFADDITQIQIVSKQDCLSIKNIDYAELGGPCSGRQDIQLTLPSGKCLYRRIVKAKRVSAEEEQLYFDTPLPADATWFSKISWLVLSRIASDTIEINHITDNVAQIQCSFEGVRDDD